jgi:hypothetical protein
MQHVVTWRRAITTSYAVNGTVFVDADEASNVSLQNHEDRHHASAHVSSGVHDRGLAPGRSLFRSE